MTVINESQIIQLLWGIHKIYGCEFGSFIFILASGHETERYINLSDIAFEMF